MMMLPSMSSDASCADLFPTLLSAWASVDIVTNRWLSERGGTLGHRLLISDGLLHSAICAPRQSVARLHVRAPSSVLMQEEAEGDDDAWSLLHVVVT